MTSKAVVHLIALDAVRHRLSRFLFQLWKRLHLATDETCLRARQPGLLTLSCKWHKPLKAELNGLRLWFLAHRLISIVSQLISQNFSEVSERFNRLWQQISPSSCLNKQLLQLTVLKYFLYGTVSQKLLTKRWSVHKCLRRGNFDTYIYIYNLWLYTYSSAFLPSGGSVLQRSAEKAYMSLMPSKQCFPLFVRFSY